MSKSNEPKEKNLKYNHCDHNEGLNERIISHKPYFYCYKCNNILLIENDKAYCTYKLRDDEKDSNEQIEFDPVIIVKNMVQRQEEQIKDINEKLVLNFSYKEENHNDNIISDKNMTPSKEINENEPKQINDDLINNNIFTPPKTKKKKKLTKLLFDDEIFEKYSKIRNRILIYIHNLCTKMEYNDSSFYFSLYLLDTYLSRIISDEITDRELFLVVLGFFLISSKYIEDDIFEPELQIFCNFEKSILLTIEEIRESEVQCLTLLNHNMYIYSVYDWITILLSNGIVFEEELNNKEELENIHAYTQKILTNLTSKIYFCKYSSIQLAFSIIQLSREKYLNKDLKLSEKIFNLLLNLYEISFSDYEDCYNLIKRDMNDEAEEESDEESIDVIDMNINSKKRAKSLEVNLTESNYSNMKEKRNINNIMGIPEKNKYLLSQNSNKYINTDFNIKNNPKKNRIKLYITPGQLNLAAHKMKYKSSKSSDKNYEMQSNNYNRNLNNKLNKKLNGNRNTLKNMSFKNSTLNLQDPKQIMLDYQKIEKHIILNSKNQKNNKNGNSNTLFINYAPKFLIKNTGPNINNINYINNININNEFINLVDKKERKIKNNTKSGLNFNYVYNINNTKESNNKYKLKKSLINRGNSINSLNYEYVIDNIRNLNINNKKKNINTSQSINQTKNENSRHKKIDKNSKDKYKTHLILDNSAGSNRIILQTEQNQKNKNNKHNNINKVNVNNINNKIFKINLGHKNDAKLINAKINLNKQNTRKLAINFRDAINKKITTERANNFLSNDIDNNSKRFKSMNPKDYIINNNSKPKNMMKNNENKSKNHNNKKTIFENKNVENKNNLFQKILKENNNLNFKNVALIKSRLPKLKVNKTGLNNK